MDWMKFYKKWATEVGSTIKEDVFLAWQAFVADAEEAVLVKAIEEIAEWYNNKNKRSDVFVANVTLYQLRETYQRKLKEIMPAEVNYCEKCDGEGLVHILDNAKYDDPDFPPKPGTPNIWAFCAIPCPVCRAEAYINSPRLKQRVYDRCKTSKRRDELFEVQA